MLITNISKLTRLFIFNKNLSFHYFTNSPKAA